MGVKTTLAGITFTTGGKAQAEIAGCDLAGMMEVIEMHCQEATNMLNYLVNDVLTPAGTESANITTINTQITNLS
jgi:hypothetical protein